MLGDLLWTSHANSCRSRLSLSRTAVGTVLTVRLDDRLIDFRNLCTALIGKMLWWHV